MMIYRHFILEVVRFGTIQEARNKSISGHMSTDGSKSTGGLVLGFLDSAFVSLRDAHECTVKMAKHRKYHNSDSMKIVKLQSAWKAGL